MKVGDYVRFYERSWTEIGQIVEEVEDSHLKVVKCIDGFYDLDNFIKSSDELIDLIEEGDYVNGFKVLKILSHSSQLIFVTYKYNGHNYTKILNNEDIKSIVTKEQFESMEYRIGE